LIPRTTLLVTLEKLPSALATPAVVDTGWTPIPPLNFTKDSSPTAANEHPIPRANKTTDNFWFKTLPPLCEKSHRHAAHVWSAVDHRAPSAIDPRIRTAAL
jgi:hypothetical protein